ncbi:MAG: hypothetical protein ACJAS9_000539 [Polaribacter sp.]|jgi:hypothetical protein
MILRRFMKHFTDQNWFAVSLDVIVVITGIFLGMQVTDWNEERNERIEEQIILKGLKEEFIVNLNEVDRNIGLNRKVTSKSYEFIDLLRSNKRYDDHKLIDKLLVEINTFGTFTPTTGYADFLNNGGKLGLIIDLKLKKQLTQWSGLMNDGLEDYDVRIRFYMTTFIPKVLKYFPLANSDLYYDFSNWFKSYETVKRSPSPHKIQVSKINLLELENILWQHKFNNDFALLSELKIRSYIVKTIEMIDQEIEKRSKPNNLSSL